MALVLLLLLLVLAGGLAALVSGRHQFGPFRRGFVSINPAHRTWLRNLRLIEPEDFLQLEAIIVSGHPGRQVGRLTLGTADDRRIVYLKRELQVRWRARLTNFLAGFGWVSRCVREASVLEALERDGLPGPHWLATGEDHRGNAFLLVQEVTGAESLPAVLRQADDSQCRHLAVCLGQTLARLHEAGFFHRDLYAKHVLVGDRVHLLDWQRAWRGAWVPHTARVRDLATLHATLDDSLAGPRDRLAFVNAYLEQSTSLIRGTASRRSLFRRLIACVESESHRLRRHRHIREKRQPPTALAQNWICLDGEAMCITPTLAGLVAGESLDWLHLDQQPAPAGSVSRRWLVLGSRGQGSGVRSQQSEKTTPSFLTPESEPVLLIRRHDRVPIRDWLRHWVLGRPILAPEQQQATLLWRLEKHGVPAPRVLAFGRRLLAARRESFLVCQPYSGTVRLLLYLAKAPPSARAQVLRGLGGFIARLHEACCYLNEPALAGLCIHLTDTPVVVLEHVYGVRASRRPQPARAARDLARLHAHLTEHGCNLADWRMVLEGHAAALQPVGGMLTRTSGSQSRIPETVDTEHDPPPSFWQRLVYGWRRLRQRADWGEFAGPGWSDCIMQVPVTDRFHAKQGRSTGRWQLKAVDGSGRTLVVYLKRHYQLSWWQRLLAVILPGRGWSPAMQEYEHLEWARQQGVPCPATVAAGEFIGPWGRLESFLAIEELTGMIPLDEAIPLAAARLSPEHFRLWKRGLAAELARLARLLHDRRHFHKDLYLCHFFIREEFTTSLFYKGEVLAWRGRVFLIDLHRLTHHPWTWWLWQLKDLAQLLYSSDGMLIDVRDQLTFWMHYRGPGARRWASRWLRAWIVFKWKRYRRHNSRNRKS